MNRNGNRLTSVAAVLALLILCDRAEALCTGSTTPISFGNYNVFSPTPVTTMATLTVTCDEAPPPNVTMQFGPSPTSGVHNPRQMKHATLPDTLIYNIYTDAAGTTVWGDGTGGTTVVVRKVTRGRPAVVSAYGVIPALQNVSAGAYGDVVTVTIIW